MPLSSRLLFTIVSVQLAVGAHLAAAYLDPEFVTPTSFPLGLPPQDFIQAISVALIAMAMWLALRPSAKWSD